MKSALRNATLEDLAEVLSIQNAKKVDVIAPASKLSARFGNIVVQDYWQELTDDGVSNYGAALHPTAVFDEGIADKLGIPLSYVRRLRTENPELWDANVNGWLAKDDRSFMVRSFSRGDLDDNGCKGIARAFLSDSYKMIDHLDCLTAVLDGVRQMGTDVRISKCDLTDRKMYVKVEAPQVRVYAENLLRGYRSPFTGDSGTDNPVVFAGFVIQNSETGSGAFSITPSMTIQVCKNGLTVTKDAVRAVHLGGKLDEGVIRWSQKTHDTTLELITLKAADAVRTFLDVEYMQHVIDRMSKDASKNIEGPLDQVVRQVAKKMLYSEEVTQGVLDHFIRGGQHTVGGVMQAVTSYAQVIPDADEAWALESSAMRALEVAASL